jgi:hypothetical protein
MMDDGASGGALRSATVEGRTSKPADNFRWLALAAERRRQRSRSDQPRSSSCYRFFIRAIARFAGAQVTNLSHDYFMTDL